LLRASSRFFCESETPPSKPAYTSEGGPTISLWGSTTEPTVL
jgi:hypothetical protein